MDSVALGDTYALLALGLLGILVVFLNWATLRDGQGLELTTSAALLITGFVGVLAGEGHTLTRPSPPGSPPRRSWPGKSGSRGSVWV